MTWPRFLLLLLILLSIAQLPVFFVVEGRNILAITIHSLPIASLWCGYAYRYAPGFRVRVVRLLAYFGDQRTSMTVKARFGFTGELTADEVVNVIQQRYRTMPSGGDIKAFRSFVRTIVEMPGWQARFEFSAASSLEEAYADPDNPPIGELLFTMPDTQNAIKSARALLRSDILPLFEEFTKQLPLRLEATEVTIRFLRQPNPYLAAYLQNVDLEKVTRLNCVIQELAPNAEADITRDKIALRATNLNDIQSLTDKHLALQWSIR